MVWAWVANLLLFQCPWKATDVGTELEVSLRKAQVKHIREYFVLRGHLATCSADGFAESAVADPERLDALLCSKKRCEDCLVGEEEACYDSYLEWRHRLEADLTGGLFEPITTLATTFRDHVVNRLQTATAKVSSMSKLSSWKGALTPESAFSEVGQAGQCIIKGEDAKTLALAFKALHQDRNKI